MVYGNLHAKFSISSPSSFQDKNVHTDKRTVKVDPTADSVYE